jgi:hypothetical protein
MTQVYPAMITFLPQRPGPLPESPLGAQDSPGRVTATLHQHAPACLGMPGRTAGNIRIMQAATVCPMPVDHDSSVPLYLQLAAELRRRIRDEGLTRLPSYLTLMQQHGVARATAERAVHILVDAGEAHIVPGKGTWAGPAPAGEPS